MDKEKDKSQTKLGAALELYIIFSEVFGKEKAQRAVEIIEMMIDNHCSKRD